ncbi:Uncharacterised protein [Salmonella enterica]|nr:Uncharacterised protein [Salmonella enterica]
MAYKEIRRSGSPLQGKILPLSKMAKYLVLWSDDATDFPVYRDVPQPASKHLPIDNKTPLQNLNITLCTLKQSGNFIVIPVFTNVMP